MPSIMIGSKIFGDMFGTQEMRRLFSDEHIVQLYLDVEAALASAQAKLGIIPAEAADAITAAAEVAIIDWPRLRERTEIVGYPDPAARRAVVALAGGRPRPVVPLGRHHPGHHGHRRCAPVPRCPWLSSGAISMRSPPPLPVLLRQHADLPMAGRTHLQHALPITFGYKAATWLSAIDRHRERLARTE